MAPPKAIRGVDVPLSVTPKTKTKKQQKEEQRQETLEDIRNAVIYKEPIQVLDRAQPHQHLLDALAPLDSCLWRDATQMFYRENTFRFSSLRSLRAWLATKSQTKYVTKLGVDMLYRRDFLPLATQLKRCKDLKEVAIGIDEADMVFQAAWADYGVSFQRQRMPTMDIEYPMNYLILRAHGLNKLRAVRIPKVTFVPYIHGGGNPRTSGPVPGGILETVVAAEMMGKIAPPLHAGPAPVSTATISAVVPSVPKRKVDEATNSPTLSKRVKTQTSNDNTAVSTVMPTAAEDKDESFRFLDLPSELQLMVFNQLLNARGSVSLTKNTPTSAYCSVGKKDSSVSAALLPQTARNILLANKQISHEAGREFFSKNKFIFYYPLQLISCLEDLGDNRKQHISSVSLWHHKSGKEGGLTVWDLAITKLTKLPKLENLEIVVHSSYLDDERIDFLHDRLEELARKGCRITFRCPEADLIVWMNEDENGVRDHRSPYSPARLARAKKALKRLERYRRLYRIVRKSAQMAW